MAKNEKNCIFVGHLFSFSVVPILGLYNLPSNHLNDLSQSLWITTYRVSMYSLMIFKEWYVIDMLEWNFKC